MQYINIYIYTHHRILFISTTMDKCIALCILKYRTYINTFKHKIQYKSKRAFDLK